MPLREMGAEGLETNGQNAGETVESEIGGTPGGTLRRDDRLHAVIDAWITLSERDRVAILKIVQTTSGQPPTG